MKPIEAVAILACMALPEIACSAEPPPKPSPWFTDYAAARAEARKAGKPMLVAFR